MNIALCDSVEMRVARFLLLYNQNKYRYEYRKNRGYNREYFPRY